MMFNYLYLAVIAVVLSGCAGLNPSTIANAVTAHAGFPSLSIAVSECVAGNDEVRQTITAPYNRIVDKWAAVNDLNINASLVKVLANAKGEVSEAKTDWALIRSTITDAGLDCGPAVRLQVVNIESTFAEFEAAILSNERAVYILEYADLLAGIVLGRRGEVVRIES